jgi:hypothetical protein
MPTETGLKCISELKAKYFPNFGQEKSTTCKDYRFSRKGQVEYKRGAMLRLERLSEGVKS